MDSNNLLSILLVDFLRVQGLLLFDLGDCDCEVFKEFCNSSGSNLEILLFGTVCLYIQIPFAFSTLRSSKC